MGRLARSSQRSRSGKAALSLGCLVNSLQNSLAAVIMATASRTRWPRRCPASGEVSLCGRRRRYHGSVGDVVVGGERNVVLGESGYLLACFWEAAEA